MAAKVLLGCFRMGEANDPEVYTTAVIAVLQSYPPDVVEFVTDPRTGIAGQQTFLPSVAELRKALDDRCGFIGRLQESREQEARQLAARREADEAAAAKPDPEDLKTRYGENYGLKTESPAVVKAKQASELQRANKVGFERACLAAGWPKDSPYSPLLVKALEERGAVAPATTPLQR